MPETENIPTPEKREYVCTECNSDLDVDQTPEPGDGITCDCGAEYLVEDDFSLTLGTWKGDEFIEAEGPEVEIEPGDEEQDGEEDEEDEDTEEL
jgi:DNA-directed RNA polymerase subunit RPC12/RpoP